MDINAAARISRWHSLADCNVGLLLVVEPAVGLEAEVGIVDRVGLEVVVDSNVGLVTLTEVADNTVAAFLVALEVEEDSIAAVLLPLYLEEVHQVEVVDMLWPVLALEAYWAAPLRPVVVGSIAVVGSWLLRVRFNVWIRLS